ncbi:MAG: HD domain-containing protein [Clostridiaceae bacterium]|nr:HD domain-containing protein [Clostridiaceae bacterium]
MVNYGMEVPLSDLVLSLSHAVDLISPAVHNHHKQVAYIAYSIGKELNLPLERQNKLLIASLLHDVGGLSAKDRIDALSFEANNPHDHAEIGYLLLKNSSKFLEVAKIIRYHHMPWHHDEGKLENYKEIPLESYIIHLADRISVLVNTEEEVITQVKGISDTIEKKYKQIFHPQLLDIFKILKQREYFWFDIVTPHLDNKLKKMLFSCNETLDIEELLGIAKIFAHIIDFRSRFTAVHSSGVAEVAQELGKLTGWSDKECKKLKIAGYLHDLGKLAIPNYILEKKGKLSYEEYNRMKAHAYYSYYLLDNIRGLEDIKEYGALHHERLDAKGYPFHKKEEELKKGARIMAVADVFTAIKEDRPYRGGMTNKEAMRVLKEMSKNKAIDSDIIDLLIGNFEEVNEIRHQAQTAALKEYEKFSNKLMIIRGKAYV